MKQVKKHVEAIIGDTFTVLKDVYNNHKEGKKPWNYYVGSRIIFPQYGAHRDNDIRISEQELRFVFVEQLNKYCLDKTNDWDVLYSIETPTKKKYRFSSKINHGDVDVPRLDPNGQSASTDLTIHNNNGDRICLVEFKANTPDPSCYFKDFLKLNKEKNGLDCECFFIQIVSDDNCCKQIENRLNKKLSKKDKNEYELDFAFGSSIHYHLFSLGGDGNHYEGRVKPDGGIEFIKF